MNIQVESKTSFIEKKIYELIIENGLSSGDMIASENKLTKIFNVSRITVRNAIASLVKRKILTKHRGKGTFVANIGKNEVKKEYKPYVDKRLALVIPKINNSFFSNIALAIEKTATQLGYNIIFRNHESKPENEERILKELLKLKVDGIILSPTESLPGTGYVRSLCNSDKNIIIINEIIRGVKVGAVACDDTEGGYIATKHLLELGHRRIAHIKGPDRLSGVIARLDGYKNALDEFKVSIDEKLIVKGDDTYSFEAGYKAMNALFEAKVQLSAVFSANDYMACGAIKSIKEHKLIIPNDISIVGYGNVEELYNVGLELTTVKQNSYEVGVEACKALIKQRAKGLKTSSIFIAPQLIIRKTSVLKL